ncbi:hypothetical protein Psuf_065850 [Phytohabitans suffuscus]|uniref:Uncharacterized protein n=1 Tax=Phytohabitans suffuscus TaxID=624315 RepID=A0A6F8YT34_9ACTN|nr:hypothetical protein Psuf_065850 [Phytohabitans suffuscus]
MGAFAQPDDDMHVHAFIPRVRPDGHGIWSQDGVTVPFFLEYDTGTEPLATLVEKIAGYRHAASVTGRVWPVLFWLHAAARERHLHARLTEAGVNYPVATAARDSAAGWAASPADDVWWLHRRPGAPLRLAELPVTDRRKQAA